jgi:hypothetical protein
MEMHHWGHAVTRLRLCISKSGKLLQGSVVLTAKFLAGVRQQSWEQVMAAQLTLNPKYSPHALARITAATTNHFVVSVAI